MPSEPRRRVLAIGLDAAEWTLIQRWVGEGKLPTFSKLLERGAAATLSTTCAEFPDSVWSSLYAGANPATYSKYFYVGYDPSTASLRHVKDEEFTNAPFWKILSDAGRTVGVIDAAKIGLCEGLNGFQIVNWGAHATKTPPCSIPADLFEYANREVGAHPVGDIDAMDATARSYINKRNDLLTGVQRHGALHRLLMREREWDVFYAQFGEPHQVGHFFWHFMDPDHPRHAESDDHGLASTVEDVYRGIDAEIGKMIEIAGDDTVCLVFAAHGMGPLYHATWNLPEILDLLGFGAARPRRIEQKKASTNPWRWLKQNLPGRLQYGIKRMLPQAMQDWLLFKWYARNLDPRGRRAFAVPSNDAVALIRVNVKGRDRFGIVEPSDYRAVCDEIATALEEMTDPVSGRRVVAKVSRIHDVYSGPFLDDKPDLSVVWDTSAPWNAVHSPRFGTLTLSDQDSRSGSHSDRGFCIAVGPGVPAGVELNGHSTYDICPTILALSDVAIPHGLDGRPLPIVPTTADV